MAFDKTALSTWTKPGDLLMRAIVETKTAKLVTVLEMIKGSVYINPYNSSVSFQAGACSFNANSTTIVGQVTLSVDEVSSQESLCVSDFNTLSLGINLKKGSSDHDDLAFVNQFIGEKVATAAYELARMFWSASKATGSGNYARTDGILYKLLRTSQSANTVSMTSAVTASNVVATVNDVVRLSNVSGLTRQDFAIVTTTANFMLYVQALSALNLYHYDPTAESFTTPVPNFPWIKIYGLPEFDGNSESVDFVAGPMKLLYWGCDDFAENEGYDIWYSQDNRAIRLALETKIGTAVGIPDYFTIVK